MLYLHWHGNDDASRTDDCGVVCTPPDPNPHYNPKYNPNCTQLAELYKLDDPESATFLTGPSQTFANGKEMGSPAAIVNEREPVSLSAVAGGFAAHKGPGAQPEGKEDDKQGLLSGVARS